ncbi:MULTISPECIES: hypothetical protein [unclassified Pseudoclavibacter]|uniref:hypothetical protein n=1 Tax=unclassified Pseudoclavibacter TaxID=2615177 RepID=UPI001BA883B6|nr:hypothetical protein [Pseudoclavibacter sp. Marseille-Q4354]MBS3177762.1 hypothetical protein [Pseudoclavibacter sp. Marseille-Q4354]
MEIDLGGVASDQVTAINVSTPGRKTRQAVIDAIGPALAEGLPPETLDEVVSNVTEFIETDARLIRAMDAPDIDLMFKTASGKKSWLGISPTGSLARITVSAIANALHVWAGADRPRPYPGNFIVWLRIDGDELTFTIVRNT